jgi:hypothetical protein
VHTSCFVTNVVAKITGLQVKGNPNMTESVDARLLGELAVVVIRAVSVLMLYLVMRSVNLNLLGFIVVATSLRS